nr:substrate-binding domain-containing protein [Luteolibacter marinus]
MKDELRKGRWQEKLPGTRVLALETGVSPPVMLAALRLLEQEGWLEGGGNRKAFRVVRRGDAGPAVVEVKNRRVIFVTHADIGDLPHSTRRVIEVVRSQLLRRNWSVEIVTFDFLHAKRAHQSWDHLLPLDPAVPMIAVFGRPSIGEWAVRHKLRMLFLGGITGELPIPVVGVKSSLLVDEAMRRLTDLGHRQIVLPLCDRPPSFAASLMESVKLGLERVGVPYVSTYHTPQSDYQRPDVIWRMVDAAIARTPPTAILVLDWKELVTIACLLHQRGLRIPDDISIVLLNEQMEADWFFPKLACFRFPVQSLANQILRWIDGKSPPSSPRPTSADFEEGDSLAAPGTATG